MQQRNIYKDIVLLGVLAFGLVFLSGKAKEWMREQKLYGLAIQAGADLTVDTVEEFGNISGLVRFEPVATANVTVTVGNFSMETELSGIDLESYPLVWEESAGEAPLGNTAILFLGVGCFDGLTDSLGYSPGRSQVEKWKQGYLELDVILTDENGRERDAKICGLLKEPGNKICMEKRQLTELFGGSARTKGGYMELYGYQAAEQAKKLLEGAGFLVEGDVE